MTMNRNLFVFAVAAAACAGAARADLLERPGGYRIGTRMVLRPSVSLGFTYDSNVNSDIGSRRSDAGSFSVNPRLGLTYQADNWSLGANVFYRYHTYLHDTDTKNRGSYGESISYRWSTSREDEGGWSFVLSESYSQVVQNDDMTDNDGRGIGRDRQRFNFAAGLEHRFSDKLHAGLSASTYYLHYKNDYTSYGAQYGWSRYTAGGSAGYAFSPYTDFSVSGSYQGYFQDNDDDLSARWRDDTTLASNQDPSNKSTGYSVHAGIGTRATERISYRVMGGFSEFRYGDVSVSQGFTYSVSGNWKIGETWNMMLLGSSYYHPSEQSYGASSRSDCVSWGVSHSMVRGKLSAAFDVAYRHTMQEYVTYAVDDYDCDVITCRLSARYFINRFCSVYASVETGDQKSSGSGKAGNDYNYDRVRGSLGVTFSY